MNEYLKFAHCLENAVPTTNKTESKPDQYQVKMDPELLANFVSCSLDYMCGGYVITLKCQSKEVIESKVIPNAKEAFNYYSNYMDTDEVAISFSSNTLKVAIAFVINPAATKHSDYCVVSSFMLRMGLRSYEVMPAARRMFDKPPEQKPLKEVSVPSIYAIPPEVEANYLSKGIRLIPTRPGN